jgi:DNA-binding IclR family transcriptional regulator
MEACGYIGRTGDHLYRPGPRCARLAFGAESVQDLLGVARPAMEDLAEATGESLVLACLAGGRRRVLARHQGGHLLTVNARRMDEGDLYTLVTTRVLLSLASPAEVCAFVEEHGAPGPVWGGADTAEEVATAAAALQGRPVVEHHPSTDIAALAAPVHVPGGMPVALGLFMPAARYTGKCAPDIRTRLAGTAQGISRAIKQQES